ncbi:hypothetical protein B0H13DRAFT_1901107 [Mycena leptocephala]|nr:hypothetical protein B0H13DRAFT_1901107 [Mycena leptocephala]
MSMPSLNCNPNFFQGSATAALTWVVYDVCLSLDREARHDFYTVSDLQELHQIQSVWRASWTLSKVLFLFSRYHTIIALGFFLMEAIGTKHFTLPLNISANSLGFPLDPSFYAPCYANLKYSIAARWYLGLTEVLSILAGELLILLRINAVYGWSRKTESVIGLATTILSVRGGKTGLVGSKNILSCAPDQANVPDVNIASARPWQSPVRKRSTCRLSMTNPSSGIYLGLVINKAIGAVTVIEAADGRKRTCKMAFLAVFSSSRTTPTLHLCLRDAGILTPQDALMREGVMLLNLVLIVSQNRYAQLGTAWLLATYSVASTRIFLNLKDVTLKTQEYNEATWRSQLRAVNEMRPVRASEDGVVTSLTIHG